MEATATTGSDRFLRWLPYWAVLQSDLRQTLRSWIYRAWVVLCIASALGYFIYRVGVYREAGFVQSASHLIGDLLRGTVLGSLTLVVVLTAGCISSERGTIADSVLSRGISRYQYFLGKWHARLVVVLGTFFALSLVTLAVGWFWLHDDISLIGSLVAMLSVAAYLITVVSAGVAVSALVNSTLVAVTALWIGLYGIGFLASFLPASFTTPYHVLSNLPEMLRGSYSGDNLLSLFGWSAALSSALCVLSMAYFSRRDV